MIFGEGQTINSANFLLVQAVGQVRQLEDQRCLQIFLEEMQNIFIGQSFDLYWTRRGKCPSQDEYMEMIRQSASCPLLPVALRMITLFEHVMESDHPASLRNRWLFPPDYSTDDPKVPHRYVHQ